MDEEQVQDPKEQVKKFFENDDFLIVSPITIEANSYYGQKSPWHEDGYYGTRAFEDRTSKGGKIYYIVNKKTGEKQSFYKNRYGDLFYDENTELTKSDIKDLIKFAPTAKSVLSDLTGSDIFKKLRQFAKGKLDSKTLKLSDKLISDVKIKYNMPGDSKVIIEFNDDDELWNILDLDENDVWFLNRLYSGNFEFTDSDRIWYDNKEGYGIFSYFNDDNFEKLKKISSTVMPGVELSEHDDSNLGKLFVKLTDNFDNELNKMSWSLIDEINTKANLIAEKEVIGEIDTYLENRGFKVVKNFYRLSISVVDLLMLYSMWGNKNADIKELLEHELSPKTGDRIGGWGDNYHEYEGHGVDANSLNNEFSIQLDKILEELESDEYKEYYELLKKITSKYKLNTWYETPKDKNILFFIDKIDTESLLIKVKLRKRGGNYWDKSHYFSEENFNNLLYQPELFDIFDES